MPEINDYCDFTVYIQKENKNSGIVYECSSYDSEMNIQTMTIVNNINEYMKKSRYDKLSSDYAGPDFSTLDERL